MKILLVDDEELQLLRLKNVVSKIMPNEELLCYTNPKEALDSTIDEEIGIAFLDIEMPLFSGIDLAKKLKKNNPQVNVIFVTAYDNYALDAYKIHASGYITKPVNETKVKEELDGLRYQVDLKPTKLLQVKCFGNFEVFKNGVPLRFHRQKSKELFAYLIDREGSSVNMNELNAILWEEDHNSYLRNLIADIQKTLSEVGASDVFIKRHNECFIDPSKIDCDAYQYKENNPDAIRMWRGEYMIQYPWALFKDE
ncbi:MAG: response regulator [Bacilli bacterium]|nr:response regulator [Bacilli bacterium]